MKNAARMLLGMMISFGSFTALGSNSSGKVYVANEDSGTLSVLNLGLNKRLGTIDTMRMDGAGMTMYMAHNVQVAPDKKSVWVTVNAMDEDHQSTAQDEVVVIDPAVDKIVQRIPLGQHLHLAHVIIDPASKYAFVTSTDTDSIIKVDVKSFAVVATIQLPKGSGPHGGRICGENLFVAEMNSKGLAIINLESNRLDEINLGGTAIQTACTKDGRTAYVTLFDTTEVARVEVATKSVTKVKLPNDSQGPAQLTLSDDNQTLLVADQGILAGRPTSNLVFSLDPQTLKIVDRFQIGQGPHGIAISASGEFAYITTQADDHVTQIDLKNKKVLNQIKVGKKPNGISILD